MMLEIAKKTDFITNFLRMYILTFNLWIMHKFCLFLQLRLQVN